MVIVAMFLNLWLVGFIRPWEYYHRHDSSPPPQNNTTTTGPEYFEDWLLLDSDSSFESTEYSLLPASRYDGVKETPLSPEEVERLVAFIHTDDEEVEVPSRKRKATSDNDSPVSHRATDGGSVSPRTRKLKIETDFGVDYKWVSGVSDHGSCVRDEEGVFGQSAGSSEFPFTFRASHPDRAIRFPSKLRSRE